MNKKFMIAVMASDQTGKTTSIAKVWDRIQGANKTDLMPRAVYEHCGTVELSPDKKVGIVSIGDTVAEIDKWVGEMIDRKCDIILCACHSDDGTKREVLKLAADNGYTLIFTSHFSEHVDSTIALRHKGKSDWSTGGVNLTEMWADNAITLIKSLS